MPESTASVVHHVPGRMRIRVPSAKGDPRRLERIKQALVPLEGIRRVEVNPALGTLVLHYDALRAPQFPTRLREAALQQGLFTLEGAFDSNVKAEVSIASRSLDETFAEVNKGLQALTRDAVNLKELLPLGILVYAVTFVDKAMAAAQWLSWVQFAFSSYMELHQDEPVAELAKSVDQISRQLDAIHAELRALSEKPR